MERTTLIASFWLGLALVFGCSSENHKPDGKAEHPEEWMYSQRAYPADRINLEGQALAVKQVKNHQANHRLPQKRWQQLGPLNIGGRINDVALHPEDEDVMYVGASVGGVWKSQDGGTNWEPIFEERGAYSIGDIAIAPSNGSVIYVGTGEANASAFSGAFFGNGIWKSEDDGLRWEQMGLEKTHHIGRIVVDPTEPERVFVAAVGQLYGTNEERGVYRSENGGESWERVLFVNDSTGCIDIVMNPLNPDVLYAAMWERIRYASRRSYAGVGSGVYKSTDGGDSWTRLTEGLPVADDVGRIGLAMSEADTSVVYAVFTEDEITNRFDALYRSDDAGSSWERADDGSLSNAFSSFGWFFGNVRVHPENADSVYVMGLYTSVSKNQGRNWQLHTPTSIHVDQHGYDFHPANSSLRVIGNDGGVYISRNDGGEWEHVQVLPISQFYAINVDPQLVERTYGGMQDNGTARSPDGSLDEWERIYGGDGFYVNIDPRNSDMIYAESQWGGLVRSEDGGDNWQWALSGVDFGDRNNWNTPVVMDPQNPNILYYGTQRLYRTRNKALDWVPISDDLTNPATSAFDIGTISTIAVAPSDSLTLFVGTDDGYVQRSTDGGESWSVVNDGLPNRYVTRVAIDPYDPLSVYVTFSGFRDLDYAPHVFYSDDGGDTWQDISGDLPEIPVNDIIVDPDVPDALYIATDYGVWYTIDQGARWDPLGIDFPSMIVNDLNYHEATRTLFAGTYGRSMFSYDLGSITSSDFPEDDGSISLRLYPNPVADRLTVDWTGPVTTDAVVEVVTITGQILLRQALDRNKLEIDVSGLTPGQYVTRIRVGNDIDNQVFVKIN